MKICNDINDDENLHQSYIINDDEVTSKYKELIVTKKA